MSPDIPEISEQIMKNNDYYPPQKFHSFLKEKGIHENCWAEIVSYIVNKIKYENTKELLMFTIGRSVNQLATNVNCFMLMLEAIEDQYHDFNRIHYLLTDLDIDLGRMKVLYHKIKQSDKALVKKAEGTMLGLIGRKSPEFLFQEVDRNFDSISDDTKIRLLTAIFMASYKPYRHPNFNHPKNIFGFVESCLSSVNSELSYHALGASIRLFDLCPQIFHTLKNYIIQSNKHKSNFLRTIHFEKLVSNEESEFSLLSECCKTDSADVVSNFFEVSAGRLADKNIYKIRLQRITLDLIKKWSYRKEFYDLSEKSWMLTNVVNADVNYTYTFLREWISHEEYNEIRFRIFYPCLILNTFKDIKNRFVDFLNELRKNRGEEFDELIESAIKKFVSDVRFTLRSEVYRYNAANLRDLNEVIGYADIDNLKSEEWDDMVSKIDNALENIDKNQLLAQDPKRQSYEHLRKDLERKKMVFKDKSRLIEGCLTFLIEIADERNLDYRKSIRRFNSKKMHASLTKCEILLDFIFNRRFEETLNFDHLKRNFLRFQNIVKYLDNEWLRKEYNSGPPYHTLLIWLSKTADEMELGQVYSNWKREINETEKQIKEARIKEILWAETWVKHVDKCLGFFTRINEQGIGIVVKNLKDDTNFFQFLTPLELGLKLREHGYEVQLEDSSIVSESRIDILASKEGQTFLFELATPDMNSDLKHSGFVAMAHDRAESVLFNKINKQISRYKGRTTAPIILIFNLIRSPDTDLYGVEYSLQGSVIDNIVMNKKLEIVNRYNTFQRNPSFLGLENAELLSAVIHYTSENTYEDIRFRGAIIPNESAIVKLDKTQLTELENIFFT
jgi:hypothetical protein